LLGRLLEGNGIVEGIPLVPGYWYSYEWRSPGSGLLGLWGLTGKGGLKVK